MKYYKIFTILSNIMVKITRKIETIIFYSTKRTFIYEKLRLKYE